MEVGWSSSATAYDGVATSDTIAQRKRESFQPMKLTKTTVTAGPNGGIRELPINRMKQPWQLSCLLWWIQLLLRW